MTDVPVSIDFDPSKLTLVIADDDQDALFALEQVLLQEGFTVHTAPNGKLALELAKTHIPDLILLDVVMPELDGLSTTRAIKEHPTLMYIPVLLLTSNNEVEDVVKGLSAGADDYVIKPFKKDELLARLMAASRTRGLYQDLAQSRNFNEALKAQIADRHSYGKIIGQSSAMHQVYSLIDKVAKTNVPVLVTGESGTGKELVAHAIHYNSQRKDQALVVQNCAAFSESLLESEIFGHIKGAFTGAIKDKAGLFEVADQGSFFLDELGEMSLSLQVKLLRVLQDGSFSPVGSTETKQSDVRVIAATNRDLKAMIAEGNFREDLYYRLNVVTINLPPLRERKTDIPLLVEHFLKVAADKNNFPVKTVTNATMRLMAAYHWPGNVRQLQNEVERMLILSGEELVIDESYLSREIAPASDQSVPDFEIGDNLKEAIEVLERKMIKRVLEDNEGNKSEAARILGISRSSLIAKVQTYELE